MNAGIEQRARDRGVAEVTTVPMDTLYRLVTGRATEGDRLLAYNALADALRAQQPGAQAVAWRTAGENGWEYCDAKANSTPFETSRLKWQALYLHPQPPSIPEPSEADVEAVSIASGLPIKFPNDRKRVVDALTTYTARLRERIGQAPGGDGDA